MGFLRPVRLVQLALVLGTAAMFALAYLLSDGFRTWVGDAAGMLARGDVRALRDYLRSFGVWAPAISLLLMVVQALVAPVPASLIVFANGLAFGVWWGWVLSLAGQGLAAAVCFWIARGLGRAPVEALVGRFGLEAADRWFERRGPRAILVARPVPGVAFDAVSYAAGLTTIGFGRFLAATLLGSAPQTFLYAYLGQSAPHYLWAMLLLPAVAVGGLAATALIQRRRGRREQPVMPPAGHTDRTLDAKEQDYAATINHNTKGDHRRMRHRRSGRRDGAPARRYRRGGV